MVVDVFFWIMVSSFGFMFFIVFLICLGVNILFYGILMVWILVLVCFVILVSKCLKCLKIGMRILLFGLIVDINIVLILVCDVLLIKKVCWFFVLKILW